MKKILYIIFGLLFLGCEDYLDVQPETLTIPEVAVNTENDIVTALHGAYSFLNDDGFAMEHNVIGSVAADNGKRPSDVEAAGLNLDRIPFAYTLDLTRQTTATTFWTDAYQVISAVNNILTRLDEVEFDPDFEARVKAESLTLRALMHFALMQVFAQDYNFTADQGHLAVPYQKETVPGSTPSRHTMAEVYTELFADVNEALPLFQSAGDVLTDEGLRQGGDIYFVSYWAALGLRARLHFYRTDYASALADANELLDGPFNLEPAYTLGEQNNDGVIGDFVDQWYGLAPRLESEAIFQLDVDTDEKVFC